MIVDIGLVLLVPGAIGYLVMHLAFGRGSLVDELLGKVPAGLAIGLGVVGATTFLSLLVLDRITPWPELATLAGLGVLAARAERRALPDAPRAPIPRWGVALLAAALALVLAAGVTVWASRTMHEPQGAWDAWDFWNMRARWFARAPEDWDRAFSSVALWSHPSYPPLLSAAVARGFWIVGSEDTRVPAIHAAVFTGAAPALLAWAVLRARGPAQAWLAGLTLCATPYAAIHGADQYADAPLAFFFLATLAALVLHDVLREPRALVLAGLAASLAALTKNEGSLFIVVLVLARSWVALRAGGRARWREEAGRFAAGAALVGALVVVFKLGYSAMPPEGEFYVGRSEYWDRGPLEHIAMQVSSPERWVGLGESWWFHLTTFDQWWPAPLLALLLGYGLIAGRSPARPRDATAAMGLMFALEALALSALFLAWSTYDIREHMDALQRLLYQWLPCVLLAFFLTVRSPMERDGAP